MLSGRIRLATGERCVLHRGILVATAGAPTDPWNSEPELLKNTGISTAKPQEHDVLRWLFRHTQEQDSARPAPASTLSGEGGLTHQLVVVQLSNRATAWVWKPGHPAAVSTVPRDEPHDHSNILGSRRGRGIKQNMLISKKYCNITGSTEGFWLEPEKDNALVQYGATHERKSHSRSAS